MQQAHWSRVTALWLILAAAHLISGRVYDTDYQHVRWDDDNWCLINTQPDQGHYQSRINLANGYIGINLASIGPFFDVELPVDGDVIAGWPLFNKRQGFATVSGFWDVQPTTEETNYPWLEELGWESVISGVPHWAGIHLEVQGHVLNASTDLTEISSFVSSWDYRDGIVTWKYTWTPPDVAALHVEYSIFLHKVHINNAAIQLKITPSAPTIITVVNALNGDAAVRTNPITTGREPESSTIWTAVTPSSVPDIVAWVYSSMRFSGGAEVSATGSPTPGAFVGYNGSSIAESYRVSAAAGECTVVEKHVGIASSDAFDEPRATARNATLRGLDAGFETLLESHRAEWNTLLAPGKVDDFHGPDGDLPSAFWGVEHQITSVVNTYYLLQNTVSDAAIEAAGGNKRLHQNGISVCGLSSDCYAGKLFWDQDVWMGTALVNSHPSAARQITDYRIAKLEDARKNLQGNYISSQADKVFSPDGAIYPWTSARYGNTTASGPSFDYEYHLNTDIGLSLVNNWITTGDTSDFETRAFPVYDAIAQTLSDLLDYNTTSEQWELKNATDPDEFANHVNNPAFTMASIKVHLQAANEYRTRFGLDAVSLWQNQSQGIVVPINEEAAIFLEYDGMNGTIEVKQADVILIDHFLDYPNDYTLSNLDYYASKQSSDGPAMTYSAFSIVALQASPSGCSGYTYDVWGSEAYTRAPFFQYSEQLIDAFSVTGFHPSFPFLTGMGGGNQVALYGYLGLKLVQDHLLVNPALPPQIPFLRYRDFFWQGHAISAQSNLTHTTLHRLPSNESLATANTTWAADGIPVKLGYDQSVTYLLSQDKPLVLSNRPVSSNITVPGNLVQCVTVSSKQSYQKGQYPLAAIDGAVSTKWIPSRAGDVSTIVIRLRENDLGAPVRGVSVDWGDSPAFQFSVALSNTTAEPPAYNNDFQAINGSEWTYIIDGHSVEVSNPYNAADAAKILPYSSNSTHVTFNATFYASRYAILSVQGNQINSTDASIMNPDGSGASVAEFAIGLIDGHKMDEPDCHDELE